MLNQGDILLYDSHFLYHLKHSVPVQVYDGNVHIQIGIIVRFNEHFVEMEDTLYNRQRFTFISRPGF